MLCRGAAGESEPQRGVPDEAQAEGRNQAVHLGQLARERRHLDAQRTARAHFVVPRPGVLRCPRRRRKLPQGADLLLDPLAESLEAERQIVPGGSAQGGRGDGLELRGAHP